MAVIVTLNFDEHNNSNSCSEFSRRRGRLFLVGAHTVGPKLVSSNVNAPHLLHGCWWWWWEV